MKTTFVGLLSWQLLLGTGLVLGIHGAAWAEECEAWAECLSGDDITGLLRADLEAGLDVTIPDGLFYLSESITLLGYPGGVIKGAGMHDTILMNHPNGFTALPNPFFANADNPEGRPTSSMLELDNATGDVTVKDMSFVVTGATPSTAHMNPFYGYSTSIDNAAVIHGFGITATFKNVRVEGEYVGEFEGAFNGRNLLFPLIVTGWGGGLPTSAIYKNNEIVGAGSGVEYFAGYGGTAEIKDNLFADSYEALWLGWGNLGGLITVKGNTFRNIETGPIVFGSNNVVFKDNVYE